ncbi:MAG: deoxyribose-phosphate aldolase [Clostridiales bacterium]|nr:MAG: deoxyribose-phosphate aldolase [Clostridiales bacterium]
MLTVDRLAGILEHTVLRPDSTAALLKDACALVTSWNIPTLSVRSCDVADAVRLLKGSGVRVSSAVDFPHGSCDSSVKLAEAQKAIDDGAAELTTVVNVGRLLSDRFDCVEQDCRALVMTAYRRGVPVKLILETCFLNARYRRAACEIAERTGIAQVVTSTGYATAGASPADIAELRGYLPDKIRIAACGGVRTLEQAVSLYAAGADRVCTGNSAHILAEAAALQRDGKALESVSAAV